MWWKVPFFLVTNSEINWIRYARLRIASALTEAAGVYSTEMETEKRKEITNSRKMKFPEKTDERETTTSPTNTMDATCQWPSMKAWRSSHHPRDGLKWKNIKKKFRLFRWRWDDARKDTKSYQKVSWNAAVSQHQQINIVCCRIKKTTNLMRSPEEGKFAII